MSSESAVLITPVAYTKMIIHARKHPTQPLSGLLVGKSLPGGSNSVFISDAVPLTHSCSATLPHPIVEAGIRMVQSQACSIGCTIVGSYFCSDRLDDNHSLGDLNKRMASKLAEIVRSSSDASSSSSSSSPAAQQPASPQQQLPSQMVAILLDNKALCAPDSPTISAALVSSSTGQLQQAGRGLLLFSTWNRDTGVPSAGVQYADARASCEALLAKWSSSGSSTKLQLWDFEEHLENVQQRDFFNPAWAA